MLRLLLLSCALLVVSGCFRARTDPGIDITGSWSIETRAIDASGACTGGLATSELDGLTFAFLRTWNGAPLPDDRRTLVVSAPEGERGFSSSGARAVFEGEAVHFPTGTVEEAAPLYFGTATGRLAVLQEARLEATDADRDGRADALDGSIVLRDDGAPFDPPTPGGCLRHVRVHAVRDVVARAPYWGSAPYPIDPSEPIEIFGAPSVGFGEPMVPSPDPVFYVGDQPYSAGEQTGEFARDVEFPADLALPWDTEVRLVAPPATDLGGNPVSLPSLRTVADPGLFPGGRFTNLPADSRYRAFLETLWGDDVLPVGRGVGFHTFRLAVPAGATTIAIEAYALGCARPPELRVFAAARAGNTVQAETVKSTMDGASDGDPKIFEVSLPYETTTEVLVGVLSPETACPVDSEVRVHVLGLTAR